jgi:hypothetical protein
MILGNAKGDGTAMNASEHTTSKHCLKIGGDTLFAGTRRTVGNPVGG